MQAFRILALGTVLSAAATVAAAGDGLWLHVRVDEAHGGKVRVNLPVSLLEAALPLLPTDSERWLHLDHHGLDGDMEDLRAVWNEVRSSPDMTFVTIDDHGETTRVWKQGGEVFVEVRADDGDERVDVRLPVAVVDAFLTGDRFDLRAAVAALVENGGGEIVEVRDREDRVRVWVDRDAEAGE